jgi:hypothetical protein
MDTVQYILFPTTANTRETGILFSVIDKPDLYPPQKKKKKKGGGQFHIYLSLFPAFEYQNKNLLLI